MAIYLSSCNPQNNLRLFIHAGGNLAAVEQEKRFQRGMTSTLVAINEGMILNQ